MRGSDCISGPGHCLLAGQYAGLRADEPSQVVVVNYNDNNNNNNKGAAAAGSDDDDTVTSFGYDVTEPFPDDISTSGLGGWEGEKPPFHGLERFVSEEQLRVWMNEWRQMLRRGDSPARVDDWVAHLFDRYGRRVIDRRPCTERRRLYRARPAAATPVHGVASSSGRCHDAAAAAAAAPSPSTCNK